MGKASTSLTSVNPASSSIAPARATAWNGDGDASMKAIRPAASVSLSKG